MLNGKKSYLISFTALFSKKGYELSYGVHAFCNVNNRYHLTAPVNSTYRTLIEDTIKKADKTPCRATGLFGKTIHSTHIAQYEGVEIKTACANVITYLYDIHRILSTGKRYQEVESIVQTENPSRVEKVVDGITVDRKTGENIVNLYDRADERAVADTCTRNTEVETSTFYSSQLDIGDKIEQVLKTTRIEAVMDASEQSLTSPFYLEKIIDSFNDSAVDALEKQRVIDISSNYKSSHVDAASHESVTQSIENIRIDPVISTENTRLQETTRRNEMGAVVNHFLDAPFLVPTSLLDENGWNAANLNMTIEMTDLLQLSNAKSQFDQVDIDTLSATDASFYIKCDSMVDVATCTKLTINKNLGEYLQLSEAVSTSTRDFIVDDFNIANGIEDLEGRITYLSHSNSQKNADGFEEDVMFANSSYETMGSVQKSVHGYTSLEGDKNNASFTEVLKNEQIPESISEFSLYGNEVQEYYTNIIKTKTSIKNNSKNIGEILNVSGSESTNGRVSDIPLFSESQMNNHACGVVESAEDAEKVKEQFATVDNKVSAYKFQDLVVNTPEVVTTVRLMEIMYGQKAAELIESGINELVTQGVIHTLTTDDIEKAAEAISETIHQSTKTIPQTISVTSNLEKANTNEKNPESILEETTIGTIEYPKWNGVTHDIEEAKSEHENETVAHTVEDSYPWELNRETDIYEIRQTIEYANIKLAEVHGREQADNIGKAPEVISETIHQSTKTIPETILVTSDLERANAGTKSFESILEETTAGTVEYPKWDGVTHDIEEAESEHENEAVAHTVEDGYLWELNRETDIHEIGRAIKHANSRLAEVHGREQADNIEKTAEAISETIHESAKTIPQTISVTSDLEKANTNEKNLESILEETTVGTIEYPKWNGVTHDIEEAKSEHENETVAHTVEDSYPWELNRETDIYEIGQTIEYANSRLAEVHGREQALLEDSYKESHVFSGDTASFVEETKEFIVHEFDGAANTTMEYIEEHGIESGTRKRRVVPTEVLEKQDSSKPRGQYVMDIQEVESADKRKVPTETEIIDLENADNKRVRVETEIIDLEDAARKRERIETDVFAKEEANRKNKQMSIETVDIDSADRKRRVIKTDLPSNEKADKIRKQVETIVHTEEESQRKRIVDTTLDEPIGGSNETIPVSPKRKIWIIMGKIASWNIWNWKKTR